jgi:pimeloyl-ACP methyl ester carboxylesterase
MARCPIRDGTLPGGLPYLAVGSGPPLLVLGGLMPEAGIPHGFARLSAYTSIRPFGSRHTAYWINRRRGMAARTTMAELAAEHATAIRASFEGPVDVVGISTGGSIALQLAVDHPDLVRRLVVASSAARIAGEGLRSQRELGEVARRGDRRGAYRLLASEVLRAGPLERLLGGLLWLAGPLAFPLAGDLSEMVATIDAEDDFDLRDRVGEIRAPTLVIGGARDRFYDRGLLTETAELIAGARLVLYPRRGHTTAVADPRFARDVRAFLRLSADVPTAQACGS